MSESTPVFSPDKTEITATAEFVPGKTDSTKVLRITSNRSWSAHLNDLDNPIDETDPEQKVDWAYLSEESHPNLTNGTESTDLVITFKRNYTQVPRRGVLHLYTKGEVKAIPINQEGAVYRLNVSSEMTQASDGGDFVPITVDCNTDWTVRIDDGSTADAVLPVNAGFDPAVVNLRVKENEEKVEKTVTLIFSATDCADQTLTITQPATTSDLKVFEIFTKLTVSGTGKTTVPWLSIDETMMDPEAVAANIKLYYETSDTSFDDIAIPTESSPELTSEGVGGLLPTTLKAFNEKYIMVMGMADGYRKSYTRIHFRNWKMGTKYTYDSSNGLEFTISPPTVKTDYVQIDKTTSITAKTDFKGSGSMYYLLHNASKLTKTTFKIAGQEAGYRAYTKNEFTNSVPHGEASSTVAFEKGDDATLLITTGTYLWDVAFLAQYKYKP